MVKTKHSHYFFQLFYLFVFYKMPIQNIILITQIITNINRWKFGCGVGYPIDCCGEWVNGKWWMVSSVWDVRCCNTLFLGFLNHSEVKRMKRILRRASGKLDKNFRFFCPSSLREQNEDLWRKFVPFTSHHLPFTSHF